MTDTTQPLAAGQWLDRLYGTSQALRQIQRAHPNEHVVFVSGAMLTPKSNADESLQRVTMTARRGAFVATGERLLFVTLWLMPMNVLFMAGAVGSIVLWMAGGGFPAVMLAAFATASLIRRRPYRLELPLSAVHQVTVHAVKGPTGDYHTLIIHSDEGAYQVVTTAPLSGDASAFFMAITSP